MYIPDSELEAQAAALWRKFQLAACFDAEALTDLLQLGLLWDVIDDEDGSKVLGQLVPRERMIVLNERHQDLFDSKPGLLRFTIAHEIGHWILHVKPALGQLAFTDGAEKIWCRQDSKEPTEFQAERFAAYLLSPTDLVKQRLPAAPWSGWRPVYTLAEDFGMTPTAMIVRLETGRWAHRNKDGSPISGPRPASGQLHLFT